MMPSFKNCIICSALLLSAYSIGFAQSPSPTEGGLSKAVYGFLNPQDSTRTKVWWFHGKFPSDKEGMTADLEAFKKIGIGGVVFYDQVHGEPLPHTEQAMSKEWWDIVYHAARETKRLGLSFEFHVSNGFVAGGPWIEPENAMKRIESLETIVKGGEFLQLSLPVPQNKLHFFKDIKVMAIPAKDTPNESMTLSSNIPNLNLDKLFYGQELCSVPAPEDSAIYINIDYGKAKVVRNISYLTGPMGKATTSATNVPDEPGDTFVGTGYRVLPPLGELQWSEDGEVYHKVCDLKPLYRAHESYKKKTLSFLPVKARFYRIRLAGWSEASEGKPLRIGQIALSAEAKVNEYEYKAGYISEYIEPSMQSPAYDASEMVSAAEVLDITHCLGTDGILRWNAPAGSWRILRLCMVPTGGRVKHGRSNMSGLECDKMSARAATLQFQSYFGQILDSLNFHRINNLTGMAMDSHEAGSQNWTDDFLAAFHRLRGYDLTPYLPVVAGYAVEDIRTSEHILYDMRLTIAELIADRYYGTFDSLCRRNHITFTAQATGNAQCIVAIPIAAKGKVQKPQGEFWLLQPNGNYDIKESSSAAHLYGKPVASAEAFTDGDLTTMPADLKNIADAAYTFGINEFVVCASMHQPRTTPAGFPGGRCYATYTRNNTWWAQSRDFWDYQARVSYVMQQGRPVTDLCIYLGNNAPTRILTHRLPKIPSGYDFDAFTEDALVNRMEADGGNIVLPTGQRYAMMVLPRSGEISLDALQKIAQLVHQGASVYGNRPTGSPCKKDIGKEEEYNELVRALWDAKHYGQGKVYSNMTLSEALQQANILPDIAGPKLYFAHRETADADIYYINNHTDSLIAAPYTFKTKHKYAQLWDAMSGKRYELPSENGNVSLCLRPRESCFIVFSHTRENLEAYPTLTRKQSLDQNWSIGFPCPATGTHKEITCTKLRYWNESEYPFIRFYSGTSTYRTRFHWKSSSETAFLVLTPNHCVTEVYVNGKRAGSIWASPWRLDIKPYLKKGENELKLYVTNSWNNRAVYDLQQAPENRLIEHPEWFVTEEDTLQDAGIAGDISIEY